MHALGNDQAQGQCQCDLHGGDAMRQGGHQGGQGVHIGLLQLQKTAGHPEDVAARNHRDHGGKADAGKGQVQPVGNGRQHQTGRHGR